MPCSSSSPWASALTYLEGRTATNKGRLEKGKKAKINILKGARSAKNKTHGAPMHPPPPPTYEEGFGFENAATWNISSFVRHDRTNPRALGQKPEQQPAWGGRDSWGGKAQHNRARRTLSENYARAGVLTRASVFFTMATSGFDGWGEISKNFLLDCVLRTPRGRRDSDVVPN